MPAARLFAPLALLLAAAPAAAEEFAFLAAPHHDLNRVFRVNRETGEVGACQYAVKDGSVGVTLCFPAGEGAGPQEAGAYDLVATNHAKEAGVYRVDRRSGAMSVCYVLGEQTVCTPPAR